MAKPTKIFDGKKMSAELFSLTYGALVVDILKDYKDPKQVNQQLDNIGFNMGTRLADDFLSKNVNVPRCSNAKKIADVLSKQVLPMYLGVGATEANWANGDKDFSLILPSNPLLDLVEVPASLGALHYSQIIAGAIRGGLEAVHAKVSATVVENPNNTEIRIHFYEVLKDNLPAGEED